MAAAAVGVPVPLSVGDTVGTVGGEFRVEVELGVGLAAAIGADVGAETPVGAGLVLQANKVLKVSNRQQTAGNQRPAGKDLLPGQFRERQAGESLGIPLFPESPHGKNQHRDEAMH